MSRAVSCTLTTLSLLLRFLGSLSMQHRSRHHGDSGTGTPGYTSSAPTMVLSSKALTSSLSLKVAARLFIELTTRSRPTSHLRKNTNDADSRCSILLPPLLSSLASQTMLFRGTLSTKSPMRKWGEALLSAEHLLCTEDYKGF